jgi:predicted nucleic acid-binding protein
MTAPSFLDTNVLVYAATRPTENDRKCRIARRLIEDTDFGISTQVLQEFYVTAVRKAISGPSPQQIMLWIDKLLQLPIIGIDPPLVVRGIAIAQRFQLSYWDAAIIAAAEQLQASVVYSEDFNDGQSYGTVRVQNPFREMKDC